MYITSTYDTAHGMSGKWVTRFGVQMRKKERRENRRSNPPKSALSFSFSVSSLDRHKERESSREYVCVCQSYGCAVVVRLYKWWQW